jgi:hypothetical protein
MCRYSSRGIQGKCAMLRLRDYALKVKAVAHADCFAGVSAA